MEPTLSMKLGAKELAERSEPPGIFPVASMLWFDGPILEAV